MVVIQREHALEQRLKSSDLALRNERAKQDALKAELSASVGGSGSFGATKNSTGGDSLFNDLNATPTETALRAELRDKNEEVGRRAVAIGKLEREVAKAGGRTKLSESRALVAEGRLVQQQSMIDIMGSDAVSNDAVIKASKQKIADLTVKIKERKKALEFVVSSLDERELEVAELRVAVEINREKRKRAEAKLEQNRSNAGQPLQAIVEREAPGTPQSSGDDS